MTASTDVPRPLLASRPKFVGRENHSRAGPTARAPSRADVPPAAFLRKMHSSNLDALIFPQKERQKIIT